MIYLAEHRNEDNIMVSKIAEDYNIPRHFLAKLVQSLAKHYLIKSVRGRNGGIKLSKPARDIRVIDIIYAVDGPPPEKEMCVIGLDICSDDVPCPLHDHWKLIKENIRVNIGHENLEILADRLKEKRQLLNQMV